jgi:hypothetical protein
MWIVITGPVMSGIAFAQPSILTEIALVTCGGSGWVFLAVLVDEIGATVEDGVRCVVTEIEKEGLVLVAFDEVHGFKVESVCEVFFFS